MARAVDLISHGAGEGIYYCLNAMASLFHGGKGSFIGSIMVIASMFGAAIAVYKMVLEQRLQIPANWLLFNSIAVIALTIPTTNVTIIDRVTGFKSAVSNVPWLFAVPTGFISQIGDVIATQIDSSLARPANVATHRSFRDVITTNRNGVAMSAKLVANAAHFDFVSNDMANNMREFVKECVYYDIALGKYSVDELKNTDNLWRKVFENASPLGGVIYQDTVKTSVEREFLTCRQAAHKIQAAWPQELRKAYDFYGKKLFPDGGGPTPQAGVLLKQNLVNAYDYLTGISKSADDLMQQNIMRNAIQDGFMTRAQEDNAVASIQSYAVARAEAYQASVYATQGGVAERAVSYMKIVIEIIFYGMFPFVAIMVVLPGGVQMLKTYLIGLVWLQSWAPLYSLINMIVHVYCREDTLVAVTTMGTPALTFDTIPSLGEAGVSVARYAGYAMMSVPFLSWGLFKYGGGALAQMASVLGQPIQSASGMAANEATSGNLSLGVRSFDSTSRSLVNSFKQDDSASINSGNTQYQTGTGVGIRITSGGAGIVDMNSSMSKLSMGITDKNEIASSMNQMSSKSLAQAQTSLKGYSSSMTAAYDQMQDFRNSRGDSLSSDSSIGTDHSTSMSKSFQRVDDVIDSFAKLTGMDKRKTVESLHALSAGISLSGGLSGSKSIPGAKLESSLSAKGGYDYRKSWSNSDIDNVSTTSQEQMQLAQKYSQAIDEVNRVSQSESFRNSSVEAANFSDGFSSKLSEADTFRRDMQNSLTESEAWQQSANLVSTSSLGITNDLSQAFVDYAAYQLDLNNHEITVDGIPDAMANPVLHQKLIDGFVQSHRDKITNSFAANKFNDHSSIQTSHNKSQASMQNEQDVRAKHSNMSQTILTSAKDKNLNVPVDTSVKDTALTQMSTNRGHLSANQQQLNTRKDGLLDSKNTFDSNRSMKEK